MQDLNEDLDGLFRKAVDQVTLKPADSRWEQLSGKIISVKQRSSFSDSIRSKYRKLFLLLALIILIPFAIVLLIPGFNNHPGLNKIATTAALQKNKTGGINQHNKLHDDRPSQMPAPHEMAAKNTTDKNTGADKTEGNVVAGQTDLLKSENKSTVYAAKEMENVFILETETAKSPAFRDMSAGLVRPDNLSPEPFVSANDKSLSEPKASLTLAASTGNQQNLPLHHLDIPRRQGFYLGLAGGLLFTEVQNQGLKKSGFDLGLFAGYTINKKFSIETGLMYTHQYYYVGGKFYNEFARTNNVISLEGNRTAFEIPLMLKYNVFRRPGGNFFVSAGVSTFIGVNDKVIITVPDGTLPPSRHFDYGVTSYLPAYVNFSIGYEYKIGKSADIRIEPYIQIPLNTSTGNSFKTEDAGGSIRVFNTGIHIGISRFIR